MDITTDKQARTLAPYPDKDRTVRIAPAMYLKVKPSGARSYVQRLQHGGKDRWRVVGHPETMPIAEAIALAHSRRAGGAAPSDSTLTCAQAVRLFVRQYIEREWKQTKNADVYALREVHTLRHMRTQRLPDGTPVRTSLQGVDAFGPIAWTREGIAKLRNTFAPVADPADEPEAKPTKKSKREQVADWIVSRASAHGACKRSDVPRELALSSGADWQHVENALAARDVERVACKSGVVVYWSAEARGMLA